MTKEIIVIFLKEVKNSNPVPTKMEAGMIEDIEGKLKFVLIETANEIVFSFAKKEYGHPGCRRSAEMLGYEGDVRGGGWIVNFSFRKTVQLGQTSSSYGEFDKELAKYCFMELEKIFEKKIEINDFMRCS